MSWSVPLVELSVADEDVESYLDSLRSGWWTIGPTTERFEREFEAATGAPHAAAVSSGTAALHLACVAADIGPGDEVIVPALTFVASAHAVRYVGGEPVLCDVGGRADPNLSVESVKAAMGPRTKAVMAVHFFGHTCDIHALRGLCDENGLALIEDCAQALGAETPEGSLAGTVGDFGCFSFFSKQQLSVGEGGMVTAGDGEAAERVRRLRSHGRTTSTWDRHVGAAVGYDVIELGFNYRLDEPHSALGISRLGRLDGEIEGRRRVAARYREGLAGLDGIDLSWDERADARAAHYAFPIVLPDADARDRTRAELAEAGIQTTAYPALHSLTEYQEARRAGSLDQADDVGACHLTLPIFGSLSDERVDQVIEALGHALSGVG
jgi:dTDP-4-amino-4,6-dideoxygalactose transaminase